MHESSDFLALESFLTDLQEQILSNGVFSALADLDNCRANYRDLLGLHDVAAIKAYSEHFYSPFRRLALVCLDYTPTQYLELLSACLQAGLYAELLRLVDQLAADDPHAAPLAVLACYRLALWPELLRYARPLKADTLSPALQLMIARAHLAMGSPGEALARLVHLQPQAPHEQRQLHILRLLARYRSGLFNSADLRLFLSLFPSATGSERAALATLWLQAEVLLDRSELISPTLTVALRQFWHGLCQPTLLVHGSELVPPLVSARTFERLAIVVADTSQLPLYEELLKAMLAQNNELQELSLLILDPGQMDSTLSGSCMDLRGLSVPEMLLRLRQLQLDVLIDTVGLQNARWLEVLAQKVATLQIGWLPPNLAVSQAPIYDALIVDRWTHPAEALQPQIKMLQLSGLATLSHPAILPKPTPRVQAAPVGSIQLVLLGSPDQLLPGTPVLLRQILELDPALTISFLDTSWRDPDSLATWWCSEQPHPLPSRLRPLAGIEALENVDARCCIGLSLNQLSPTISALQLISLGIPIVCLASDLQGIKPMRAILEALGLQAFITEDPEHLQSILAELLANSALRTELSDVLPAQLASSLVMDIDHFASDLLQGLRLLKHTS